MFANNDSRSAPSTPTAVLAGICFLSAALLALPAAADSHDDCATTREAQLTLDLLTTYENLDWEGVANSFTENGALHSVMRDPFRGRDTLHARMVQFHEGVESMRLDVINICARGNVVFVERIDSWVMNGVERRIPAVGVLEFDGDLVKLWKEYYDLDSLKARMDPAFPGEQ
jgi:limonene-1,2-epoxide hydrolase